MIDLVLTRALGVEIARERKLVGLSQAELVERMPSRPHVKTYATYEQGIRQCTVAQLVEVCDTIGTSAPDVLMRALMHLGVDLEPGGIYVDLRSLAGATKIRLQRLRRWARSRLDRRPEQEVVCLSGGTLREMAVVFDVSVVRLVRELERFAPGPG